MKTNRLLIVLVLVATLLLASCNAALKVGALHTESKSVEQGAASSVKVKINFGAGSLNLAGGSEKLMEANFTYNVAKLKPEVEYKEGTLTVVQPEVNGFPSLLGLADFRNEWVFNLSNNVPMDLSVNVGAGTSNLTLSGLLLSGLDITLGAAEGTIDLSGNWAHDLNVTIDAGASNINVVLPKDVGVRVVVDRGPTIIETQGLTKDGDVYTNAAFSASDVTLHIDLKAGIGTINLLETQ